MRTLAFGLIAAAGLTVGSAAGVGPELLGRYVEPRTTRIETRPFYGAIVTLEEGVRVFRPLPRHDRIIINPGDQTPVGIDVGTGAPQLPRLDRGR